MKTICPSLCQEMDHFRQVDGAILVHVNGIEKLGDVRTGNRRWRALLESVQKLLEVQRAILVLVEEVERLPEVLESGQPSDLHRVQVERDEVPQRDLHLRAEALLQHALTRIWQNAEERRQDLPKVRLGDAAGAIEVVELESVLQLPSVQGHLCLSPRKAEKPLSGHLLHGVVVAPCAKLGHDGHMVRGLLRAGDGLRRAHVRDLLNVHEL
mmetsp:Transcript_105368/g.250858  ORF Transcript_105368/g.250858 Transcript_105368/m.250858 type:complete len:211 (-) Transcript_105368:557-1189(-)